MLSGEQVDVFLQGQLAKVGKRWRKLFGEDSYQILALVEWEDGGRRTRVFDNMDELGKVMEWYSEVGTDGATLSLEFTELNSN